MQTTQTQETFDLLDQDYEVDLLLQSAIVAYHALPVGPEKAKLLQHIKVFEETVAPACWHIDDVKSYASEASDEEAKEILNLFVSTDLSDYDWYRLENAADKILKS